MKKIFTMRLLIAAILQFSFILYAAPGISGEKGDGMESIIKRCEKYFTDKDADKKCKRDERRAAMDIYDLVEDLKDKGKPMRESASSKEFSEEAVLRGKYFSACAILFELHKDQVDCYQEGIKQYQERIERRLAGNTPFSEN